MHRVLDMAFREGESRRHCGNSRENLALMRKLAVGLLKREKSSDASLKTRRLRRGRDDGYLDNVLAANNVDDA